MIFNSTDPDKNDKPIFLKAIELLVSGPEDIKKTVEKSVEAVNKRKIKPHDPEDLRIEVASHIIERYAKTCGRVGAVTSLGSAIPGIGTVVALVGTSAADLVVTMKYQVEMVAALAHLFERDIDSEEEQRLHYAVAGLGVATQAGVLAFENFTVKAIREAAKRLIKGKAKRWFWDLFKKLGMRFVGKGLLKAIPLGIGVGFSYWSNKKLTRYVGRRARDYFIGELQAPGDPEEVGEIEEEDES